MLRATGRRAAGLLAVSVVALAATNAPATHSGKQHGKNFKNAVFRGTVESVPGSEVVVTVLSASSWGRGAEGRRVTFVATETTRIAVPDRDGDGQAELSDLQPNDGLQLIARVAEDEEYHGDVELNALDVTWGEWGQ